MYMALRGARGAAFVRWVSGQEHSLLLCYFADLSLLLRFFVRAYVSPSSSKSRDTILKRNNALLQANSENHFKMTIQLFTIIIWNIWYPPQKKGGRHFIMCCPSTSQLLRCRKSSSTASREEDPSLHDPWILRSSSDLRWHHGRGCMKPIERFQEWSGSSRPLCSNPFYKWFWNGFWVPKHLLAGYLEH